jgi:1,4-alpha-glucan branching enzyme
LFCIILLKILDAKGQIVTTNPAIPSPNQPVTITINVAGTSLAGHPWNNDTAPVWIWAWLEKGAVDIDAPTNVNPATPSQDAAKCTRIGTNPDIYQITFTPTTFFNRPASEISRIGLKLKTRNWNDNKQTDNDRYFDLSLDFSLSISSPNSNSFFVNNGEMIPIVLNSNQASTFTIKVNNVTVTTSSSGINSFSFNYIINQASGTSIVTCSANNGTLVKEKEFSFTIRSVTINQTKPQGIIPGINYNADHTKATLCLWAPLKSSVYVVGDFTNWKIQSNFQMKKSGEYFWIELSNLTPQQEYGFQYLVDETIWVADPYSDKILDPEDRFIPESTYPNLKDFPELALKEEWYFNRVSVLQTNQTHYNWQTTNFIPPDKNKLVIYEALIRDLFDSDNRNYQNLIDTLGYFKKLGINAIELMPVMEFNGNEGWGYNPTFMFAPDKYYGTKNKLKEFVDICHQNGIAVILDIALNHQDLPNPYALMYFNHTQGKPTEQNPWFNTDAKHPFNVFYDMNHESSYTKNYLDTINYYWLNEFKVDGYRFDLSKGFTQTNNPSDVGAWSAYDQSRVNILRRMADKIWERFPNAIVMLEHLGSESEEKVLAEYRANEGKGMLLWGKMTDEYNQNTMGFASNSNISRALSSARGMNTNGLVAYMESHDEERIMYKNKTFGNSLGSYSTKDTDIALKRTAAAFATLIPLPGPKMIWQFGELGYDESINLCVNGTVGNCRLDPKPVRWEYLDDFDRKVLSLTVSDLINLKKTFPVFQTGTATINESTALIKSISIRNNPYTASPVNAEQTNVVIVANFDLSTKSVLAEFPHTGTWYEYNTENEIAVLGSSFSISLARGEYKMYTDFKLPSSSIITSIDEELANEKAITIYPNPSQGEFTIEGLQNTQQIEVLNMAGQKVNFTFTANNKVNLEAVPGLYLIKGVKDGKKVMMKIMIK